MDFEFDPLKSIANEKKHGINFSEAQILWNDPDRIVIPARTVGETRFLLIAENEGVCWSAIYTLRGHVVRIISVRNSRENEKEIYFSGRI
jgi:uncharacterized DUF497 family protein